MRVCPPQTDPVALTLVAAIGRNGELGVDGDLPFRLRTDLALFRKATWGKPVLMGRKTWDSLPVRPMKGRPAVIVTRNSGFSAPGARVTADLSSGLAMVRAMAAASGVEEACILGGGEIYAACLPFADRMRLTHVDAAPRADAFFPAVDWSHWREVSADIHPEGPDDSHPFVVRNWARLPDGRAQA